MNEDSFLAGIYVGLLVAFVLSLLSKASKKREALESRVWMLEHPGPKKED